MFDEENALHDYQQQNNYLDKGSYFDWIVMWDAISRLQRVINICQLDGYIFINIRQKK